MNIILLYWIAESLRGMRRSARDEARVWEACGYQVKTPLPFAHQVSIALLAAAMLADTVFSRRITPLHDLFLIIAIAEFSNIDKRMSWAIRDSKEDVRVVSHDYVITGCIAISILLSPSVFYLLREAILLAGMFYASGRFLVVNDPKTD